MPDTLPNQNHESAPAPQWQITSVLRVSALALLLLGCFVIIRPFLTSLLWAVVLCVSSFPIYARLLRRLRGRRTLAAAIMTLGIVLTLLAPFILIGLRLADDVQSLMAACQNLLASRLPKLPAWIERVPMVGERIQKAWQHFSLDTAWIMIHLRQYIAPATSYLLIATGYFLKGLAELALSIILAFFLFRDGAAAARRLLLTGERLAGNGGEQLIALAASTIRGVVYGILGTALCQSIIAGIGFAIAGVPGAGFLTLLTFFLSVTPIGAPMIWIPAAIWLFLKAGIGWGDLHGRLGADRQQHR